MTEGQLRRRLLEAWSERTASTWRKDNPALGQCSVTALVAQDMLGGELLKTRVGDAWHFYNRVGGRRVDLTASQFSEGVNYDDLSATKEEAMADTSAPQLLALREALFSL